MKSGPLLLFPVALVACSRHGGAIIDHGPDGAPPAPDAAAPADRPLPPVDAAADLGLPDAGPAPPAAQAYRDFVDRYNEAQARRLVSCFNVSASSVQGIISREVFDTVILSLGVGLATWDADQAARCLQALATAPCEDVASGRALAACGRVLAGHVGDDGYCLNDEDCREPGRACGGSGVGSCGRVCQRSLAPSRSAGTDGQACPNHDCMPGLYCRESDMFGADGVCRPIAPGGACDSSGQCPFPYVCVADVAGKGTCGVGKGGGQPCHVWTERSGLDSECNPFSRCLPRGAGPTVCVPDPPGPRPATPVELPAGAPCLGDDQANRCRVGTFCRIDPAEFQRDPPPPHLHGFCQAWRRIGEACEEERACGPGAACLHGFCTACPGAPGAASAGGTADAGAAGDGGCGVDLKFDPANCGACGHGCQGGACYDGQCQPRSLGGGIDPEIAGMAVDETGVYLTEDIANGRVLRVTADGSQPYQVLASGQSQPEAVTVDASHVYWVSFSGGQGGAVSRVPKAGGAVEVLAPAEAGPTKLAVDGTHVYWTNIGEGPLQGVRRLAKGGALPETLVPGIYPGDVALDATDFYWTDYGNGTLSRRPKLGGAARVLATGEESASHVVVDDRRVYWSSAKHVASMPKTGGPVTEHALEFNAADLAVSDGILYWSTSDRISRAGASEPLPLLDSSGLREIEVRGAWIYFVAGQSLVRIPK